MASAGFLNYQIRQSSSKLHTDYKRPTLTDLAISLGGFISMITRLTNFALRGYQGYSIDKSLIKKVFSVRKDKKSDERKTRMESLSNLK